MNVSRVSQTDQMRKLRHSIFIFPMTGNIHDGHLMELLGKMRWGDLLIHLVVMVMVSLDVESCWHT